MKFQFSSMSLCALERESLEIAGRKRICCWKLPCYGWNWSMDAFFTQPDRSRVHNLHACTCPPIIGLHRETALALLKSFNRFASSINCYRKGLSISTKLSLGISRRTIEHERKTNLRLLELCWHNSPIYGECSNFEKTNLQQTTNSRSRFCHFSEFCAMPNDDQLFNLSACRRETTFNMTNCFIEIPPSFAKMNGNSTKELMNVF